MIEKYLLNTNENATVPILKKKRTKQGLRQDDSSKAGYIASQRSKAVILIINNITCITWVCT
jgi:hypothetical protein